MMFVRCFVVLALALAVGGCSTFQYEGESFAPNQDRVLVFNTTQPPVKSMWQVIGVGAIKNRENWCSDQSLIGLMRQQAAEHGADAIHILSIRLVPVDDGGQPLTMTDALGSEEDGDQTGWALLSQDFGMAESGYPSNHPIEKDAPETFYRVLRAEFLRHVGTADDAPPAPEVPAAPEAPAAE